MAKTEAQIQDALKKSIEATDATIDTEQGPVPDTMIRPQSGQLAEASADAESLRSLFTLQFNTSATEEEIGLALGNYGSAPGEGGKARHIQYFMRFTRPSSDIPILAGTLVGNSDGSLTYRVVNTGTITFSSIDTFFNSTRNAYEIGLLVEATGTGSEYELSKFRVSSLITPVYGIDSTENRSKSQGGVPKETVSNQSTRLKSSMKGINLGAPNGLRNKILNSLSSEITDVAIIQPFELEFQRIIAGPALDIYVIGQNVAVFTETVVAITGQTEIVLKHKPAISVNSLLVNGVSGVVTYSLVNDLTQESGRSLNAYDTIVLNTALISGDVVVVEYQYNKALEDVRDVVFAAGEEYLFNTDILIRAPFVINPIVEGEVRTLPSYPTNDIEVAIEEFNATTYNFSLFQSVLYYEKVRQDMITAISGIQTFKIKKFRRNTGSLSDLEPIVLKRNEVLEYNPNIVNIKVIQ